MQVLNLTTVALNLQAAESGACDMKETKKGFKCTACNKLLRGWECAQCKKDAKPYQFEDAALKDGLKCPNCSGKLSEADLVAGKQCIFCKKDVVEVDLCIKRVYACSKHPTNESAKAETCDEEVTDSKNTKKCGAKYQLVRVVPSEIIIIYECPKCRKGYDKDGKCDACKQTLAKKKACSLGGNSPHIRESKDTMLDEKGLKQKYTQLNPPVALSMRMVIDYEADKETIAQLKQSIEFFATILWNNTGGNMYLQKAVLANKAKTGYVVFSRLPSGEGGHTNHDQAMVVSSNLLTVGPPGMGYSIVGAGILHEFGHSMFYLPDEYKKEPVKECVMDPRSRKFDLCQDCKDLIAERFKQWNMSAKAGKQPQVQVEIISGK
jgi:DNA-directed RNA polymerase subunit RPC12/RpoP